MKKTYLILFAMLFCFCIYAQETDSLQIKKDEIKKSLENIHYNCDSIIKRLDSIQKVIDGIKPLVISFNHESSIDKYSKNIDCLYYLRKPNFSVLDVLSFQNLTHQLNRAPREADKQQVCRACCKSKGCGEIPSP